MSFSVCVLASSSDGNAVLVSTGSTKLLVDAGLSGKRLLTLLGEVGVDPSELQGIFVTHEHTDHTQGVGVLARKLKLPVLATPETFRAARDKFGTLPERRDVYPGRTVRVGDLDILPFRTFHDAAMAVAIVVKHDNRSLGIMTDVGHVSHMIVQRLRGCSTVVLEANYCPDLLRNGPYPWALKQRILGNRGHLSNQDACRLIVDLARNGLQRVLLSHLSETNNHPDVVMRALVDGLPPDVMERTAFFLSNPTRPGPMVPV